MASGLGCLLSPKFQNLETLSLLFSENRNLYFYIGKYFLFVDSLFIGFNFQVSSCYSSDLLLVFIQ